MTTMTLKVKSYADVAAVEAFARQRVRAAVDSREGKRRAALKAYQELAAESRTAAIEAGYVTEEQVNALIEECMEEVRREAGEIRLWGKNAHRN